MGEKIMTDYYTGEEFISAKKQKKKILTVYFVVLAIYLAVTLCAILYSVTLPYSGYKDTLCRRLYC